MPAALKGFTVVVLKGCGSFQNKFMRLQVALRVWWLRSRDPISVGRALPVACCCVRMRQALFILHVIASAVLQLEPACP